MKITNKSGLPDAIYQAVTNDDYDRGESDITVTQLISPPRQVALTRANYDHIEDDAANMIWALMGKAIHGILERAETVARVEDRLYVDCLGWKVGGQFDRCALVPQVAIHSIDHEGPIPAAWIMQDYKMMSAWELIHGLKPEREQQLNLLGYLARQNGTDVIALEAVCLLRDWSKLEAFRNPDYPQSQVHRVGVKLWTDEECHDFLMDRVSEHQKAQRHELPLCTDEERWAKPTKWAVMKEGRKSAMRLLDSEEEAQAWIADNGHAGKKGISIVCRPGEYTRCLHYCNVAPFCEQHPAFLQDAAE